MITPGIINDSPPIKQFFPILTFLIISLSSAKCPVIKALPPIIVLSPISSTQGSAIHSSPAKKTFFPILHPIKDK